MKFTSFFSRWMVGIRSKRVPTKRFSTVRLPMPQRLLHLRPQCNNVDRFCHNTNLPIGRRHVHVHSITKQENRAIEVQIGNNGKKVTVETMRTVDQKNTSTDVSFHATWLRHNCQCPSCATTSGQRSVHPIQLIPTLTMEAATLSGNRLDISWSCGHHGYLDVDWLMERSADTGTASQENEDLCAPLSATKLPVLSYRGLLKDKDIQWRWLQHLNEYGACLLTDMGTERDEVIKLAQTMYCVQSTIYGETFDVEAKQDFINVAYSTQQLGFHMDLVYYEGTPGLQLLHCLQFDECVEGGESVLLDMFPVVEDLREKYPKHFNTLVRVPATFQKIHYDREEPVDMRCQCPHIEVNSQGKVVSMTWSPPFEGPLSVPEDDVEPYYEAYYCMAKLLEESNLKIKHRLQPGETLTFNNRRVLHARDEFKLNGGGRHLQGAYVNIDDFKSKFTVLCKQVGKPDFPVRRVFNRSST